MTTDNPKPPPRRPNWRGSYATVSPAEVKAVFDALGHNTSPYTVARRLTQAGRPIHHKTVKKWKATNFKPGTDKRHISIDTNVPVLTGDPTTTVTDLVPPRAPLGEADGSRYALEKMSTTEVMMLSARDVHITAILLAREIQRQGPDLVARLPQEVGNLLRAIAMSLQSANAAYVQARDMNLDILGPVNGSKANGHANGNGFHKSEYEDWELEGHPMEEELKAWGKVKPQ